MTAEEALKHSVSGVIRAQTEGALLAISRSPDGFQLCHVPKAGGRWNLGAVVYHGSYSTLDQAVERAEVVDWQPAPENIIGDEAAASIVPSVEGRQIRSHGEAYMNGRRRSTFLGHPLHPQLILFPAGLLPYSLIMDVLHHATGRQSYADAAWHTMWGGVIGGLAAGAAGAVDYLSIPDDSSTKDLANVHGAMNIGVLAFYGLNLLMRRDKGHRPSTVSTVLSGIATTGLLISAWYGAHMVYEHGLRVAGVDELADARDLAPPGDDKVKRTLEQLPERL